MIRILNFNPGPAMLPSPVLEQVQAELLDYRGLGMSVMEISHRSDAFEQVAIKTEQQVRTLLGLGAEHAVLFLAGGATHRFAEAPLNLASDQGPGAYLVHGHWGRKAFQEAQKLGRATLFASSERSGFDRIPRFEQDQLPDDARYVHLVSNETISGVQFHDWPVLHAPLVVDMTSDIMSRPLDMKKFGVIYAGAQKNLGIAGLSVLIARQALLDRAPADLPGCLNWKTQQKDSSRFSTPPVFAWYVLGLVLDWLQQAGGLIAMQALNREKARLLYDLIDRSGFYVNTVRARQRSEMNIPFRLADAKLEVSFLAEALQAGLAGLKGHVSVGGMRASIYNAMPLEGVSTLADFMTDFERRFG